MIGKMKDEKLTTGRLFSFDWSICVWFPLCCCRYVLAQAATAHYNLRQFDEAQSLFETLHKKSPHRIESMDIYSNILYVKEAYAALSHLAHHAILTDKYVVCPFYSLSLSLPIFSIRSEKDQKIVDRRDQMTGKFKEEIKKTDNK